MGWRGGNLETVVGRARWCVWAGDCSEARRRQAGACNDERERSRCRFSGFTNPAYPLRVQRQARGQAYQRVRSGLNLMVNMIEGEKANIHAECHTFISGQLRFLGSLVFRVFGVFGDRGFDQLRERHAVLD